MPKKSIDTEGQLRELQNTVLSLLNYFNGSALDQQAAWLSSVDVSQLHKKQVRAGLYKLMGAIIEQEHNSLELAGKDLDSMKAELVERKKNGQLYAVRAMAKPLETTQITQEQSIPNTRAMDLLKISIAKKECIEEAYALLLALLRPPMQRSSSLPNIKLFSTASTIQDTARTTSTSQLIGRPQVSAFAFSNPSSTPNPSSIKYVIDVTSHPSPPPPSPFPPLQSKDSENQTTHKLSELGNR